MQWIPSDDHKRRDEAFADFIVDAAYEEDSGWTEKVWDAAWSARGEWQGLTDEDIQELHYQIKVKWIGAYRTEDIYRSVEAKLREKNGTRGWFTIDEFNEWAEKLIEKGKNT